MNYIWLAVDKNGDYLLGFQDEDAGKEFCESVMVADGLVKCPIIFNMA